MNRIGRRRDSAPRRRFALFLADLLCGVFVAVCPARIAAAEAADPPPADLSGPLSAEERANLVARLSDEQARALLIRELDRAAAGSRQGGAETTAATAAMIGGVGAGIDRVQGTLARRLGRIEDLPSVPGFIAAKLTADRSPRHLLVVAAALAVALGGGAGAEWLFRRAMPVAARRMAALAAGGPGRKLGAQGLLLLQDLLALAVFAAAGLALFFAFYEGHKPTRLVVLAGLIAVLIVRLAALCSRFLFAPRNPALRLVPVDDACAALLHRRILWFAGVAAVGALACDVLELLGLDKDLVALLRMLVGIALTVMLIALIWRVRRPIAALIRGSATGEGPGTSLRRAFADVWHVVAIVYVLCVYAVATVSELLGQRIGFAAAIASVLVVAAVPLVDAVIRDMLDRAFDRRAERTQGGRREHERVIRRAVRAMLLLIAIFLIGQLWGVDIFFVARESVGAVITRAILDIGLTLLVAYVVWELAKAAIDRRVKEEELAAARGHEAGGASAARLRTLLVLSRRFLLIVIAAITVMVALSSLGVDIGPLLAGAGVIGLAVGFGAQTLVKDIVSGIFFLVDDAFRLGEYIDVGAAKGTVEKINVRSVVLRHHRGPLNTVPFGEISQVTNYSRDWVIMKLEFRVPYDTDLGAVKRIFKQIGADLMADPELAPGLIEPLKSQGVMTMDDSGMVIRAKFMARPGEQFQIRREVYARVQKAFREQGIEFAHRRVAVELPPGVDEDSPQGKALARAGAAATGDPGEIKSDARA